MLRLPEGLEDMIHIAGGDATPRVSYLEVDLQRRVYAIDPHDENDVADVRVLHGIRDEVDQNLPKLEGIRLEHDRLSRTLDANAHSLQFGDGPNDIQGFLHDVGGNDARDVHDLLAGVEPREAQQFLDERQNVFAGPARAAQMILLHGRHLAGDFLRYQLRIAENGVQWSS